MKKNFETLTDVVYLHVKCQKDGKEEYKKERRI